MNPKLEKRLRELQDVTNELMKEVSALSSVTYHHEPGQGKWSISQILTHLLTSERLSLAYMKKKSQAPLAALENAGFMAHVRFMLLLISQRLPLRYKAPRVVLDNTPHALSFGDLVRQWESTRSELRAFLEMFDEQSLNKEIFKHPYAGKLNVMHAVQFMTHHIQHHQPQISRIIRNQRQQRALSKNAAVQKQV